MILSRNMGIGCAHRLPKLDRRRDYVKDRTATLIFPALMLACCLFWMGVFRLIF
jgi:hypothetical protein